MALENYPAANRWYIPLGFGGSDEAMHDWMPIEMAQAGDGSPGRVVSALKDLIRWYLDVLALSPDPVATAVCLIIGGLTISLGRAAGGVLGVQWSFGAGHFKASEPICELASWIMTVRARR